MPTHRVVIESSAQASTPVLLRDGMATRACERVWTIGNLQILDRAPLGFFCSTRCPGEVIVRTYDVARALRDTGMSVIGGFHTPMEQECLRLMLRGQQPIVICPARSIVHMRLPTAWQQALATQRLLLLSPFDAHYRRPTVALTEQRNRFVAALAKSIFIAYAAPGSKTAALCHALLQQGQQVFVLEHEAHASLLAAGAQVATMTSLCRDNNKSPWTSIRTCDPHSKGVISCAPEGQCKA